METLLKERLWIVLQSDVCILESLSNSFAEPSPTQPNSAVKLCEFGMLRSLCEALLS